MMRSLACCRETCRTGIADGDPMSLAIELDKVSKRYWQVKDRSLILSSLQRGRSERSEHWALRDASVEVQEGETVGILGRNGAGKTTLLRILAGVSRPTEGTVRIKGRVAPLIGVGVGFHPELSGRENIYVNGMLLGLSRGQVDERLDSIVAFSEIEDFIDTPVKFYSSGMFLRLGFSVAIHVEPNVLLVDEVLAVGDLAFQAKCFERMRALQADGTTIVMVSHSMHAIRLLCPRAILVRSGRLDFDGPADEAVARYHEVMSYSDDDPDAQRRVHIDRPVVVGSNGPTHHPETGEHLEYTATLHFHDRVDSPHIQFRITTEEGVLVYTVRTVVGKTWRCFGPGDSAQIRIPFEARLGGGSFRVALTVFDQSGREIIASHTPGLLMYMAPKLGTWGIADLDASISVDAEILSEHGSILIGPSAPPDQGVMDPN